MVKLPPKMTTKEFQSRIVPIPANSPMCWEHAIEAFGVTAPRTGVGAIRAEICSRMKAAGFFLEETAELAPPGITPTLAVFAMAHQRGDWLIFTSGHCLSMRDGKVWETMPSATVKRRVTSAYRVTWPKPAPGGTCACADPLVFGHWDQCLQFRKQLAAKAAKS